MKMNYDIDVMRLAKWDFEKATHIQRLKNKTDGLTFSCMVEAIEAGNELKIGIVNNDRLNKIKNHFKNHKKEYIVLGTVVILLLVDGAMMYANPVANFAAKFAGASSLSPVAETTVAALNMPVMNMGAVTSMINRLINNLITLGILATISSCVFEMVKSIVEGNISRLPKTLITHGMMSCCILIAPTVFNFISSAFNMGSVFGALIKAGSLVC